MTDKKVALLSVSDKKGIETLARGLVDFGFEILSTGGTAEAIRSSGLPVTMVADYTGSPEALGGRIKTLDFKIYSGILAHDTKEDQKELCRLRARYIDLVVVNLYPLERVAARPGARISDVTEAIDIGGPSLLRAAAKNFQRVTVLSNPDDYERVLWHLAHDGKVPLELNLELAVKAFAHTASYDAAVFQTLAEVEMDIEEDEGDQNESTSSRRRR